MRAINMTKGKIKMRHVSIAGCGSYAPQQVIKNDYFDRLYKKDVSTFLETRRNIFERRYMDESQVTSDLIVPAAEAAMSHAGIETKDLDLILVATDTPDYVSPATAAVVQYKLGAKKVPSFDINSACAGFVTAFDAGRRYIQTDENFNNVLVVGAYGMSRYIDYDDYKVASLFADGAGAVVLQPSKSPGVLNALLDTDGQYHDCMGIYAGGTSEPLSENVLDKKRHKLQFVKRIPTETNSERWPVMINTLLDRCNKKPSDIDHCFFTQINIESIDATLDKLGLEKSKSHNIMDRFGYTGSACIPMALSDAKSQNKLNDGDFVVLMGSGGGMSMAAVALIWKTWNEGQ